MVTITGSGFGTLGGSVQFGTVDATTSSWTDTDIVFEVPAGTSGKMARVSVTPGSDTASNTVKFRFDNVKASHRSFLDNHPFMDDGSFGDDDSLDHATRHHYRHNGDFD